MNYKKRKKHHNDETTSFIEDINDSSESVENSSPLLGEIEETPFLYKRRDQPFSEVEKPLKESPKRKECPTYMTDLEKSVIMGTLLGDGHLNKRGKSVRLKIEHGIDQEDLVWWKYEKLKRLCPNTKPPHVAVSKKGFKSILFYTSSSRLLEEMHQLYYKKHGERYKKVITSELIDQLSLDSIVLAIWYMDDGSVRDDCYSGKIASQGFSLEENHLLRQYLLKKNIETNVVKHKEAKGQYYLTVPACSFQTFIDEVEAYLREVPSMVHKLCLSRKSKVRKKRKPRND
jgi:hypothetical protein